MIGQIVPSSTSSPIARIEVSGSRARCLPDRGRTRTRHRAPGCRGPRPRPGGAGTERKSAGLGEVFTFGFDLRECGRVRGPPTGQARPAHTPEKPHAIARDVSAETRRCVCPGHGPRQPRGRAESKREDHCEPPIGIEPMTYALRVRRSNRLS
jgi:hypothetical protein